MPIEYCTKSKGIISLTEKRKLVLRKSDFEYAEILLLIMISVAPYISVAIKLGLQVLIVLINVRQIRNVSKSFYVAFVFMLIPSLLDLFNASRSNPYSGNNLLYPLSFLVGALIACKYDKEYFLFKFEKILYVLGILSLVGMSIYYIAPGLINRFPTYTFYTLTHRTIYFFNYIYAQGFLMVRNSGIAWEPGVFQILMNLGLSISVAGKEKFDYKRIIVYSLAVILTRSTTGLIILMINLVLVIRKKKGFIILLLLAITVFSTEIYNTVSYQLTNKWVGSLAFNNRYIPTVNAFKAGITHPFGIGSTGYNAIYEQERLGSFDSYTQILMRYGYGLLCFIIYTLAKIIKKHWYIGIILAVSMLSESMWNCVLFTTIYFIYLRENEEVRG